MLVTFHTLQEVSSKRQQTSHTRPWEPQMSLFYNLNRIKILIRADIEKILAGWFSFLWWFRWGVGWGGGLSIGLTRRERQTVLLTHTDWKIQALPVVCNEQVNCANACRLDSRNSSRFTKLCPCASIALIAWDHLHACWPYCLIFF